MEPELMTNQPLTLPMAARSMAIVPEPALTIAAVMRVASAAPSTVSPGLSAAPEADVEVVDALFEGVAPFPQALSASAPDRATAASETVFTKASPHGWRADQASAGPLHTN